MRHDHAPRGRHDCRGHRDHHGQRGRRAYHARHDRRGHRDHHDRHGQRGHRGQRGQRGHRGQRAHHDRRDRHGHQRLLEQRPLSPRPSRRRRRRIRQDALTNLQTQGRSKTTHQPLQPSAPPWVLVDKHAHRHLVQPAL